MELIKYEGAEYGLTKSESRVYSALTNRKIRDYDKQELVQATATLTQYICKDCGISISNEDKQYYSVRFMQALSNYYSNLSTAEIKLAFELTSLCQLDNYFEIGKNGQPDKHHYQKFSLEYIGKVLKAYNRYKSEVRLKVQNKTNELKAIEVAKTREGNVKRMILERYRQYLKGEKVHFGAEFLYINTFIDLGILKGDKVTVTGVKIFNPYAVSTKERNKNKKIIREERKLMAELILQVFERSKAGIINLENIMKNGK